ncbi:MAG: hypothetical protein H8E91_02855 [Planctomycetes bacterium]|nr:hypothetical protein [Planctomycetota bacterium]
MFAWKSMVLGLGLLVSVGVLPACQNGGTFEGEVITPLVRITGDFTLFPIGDPRAIDIDGLIPTPITFNGDDYFYYPSTGWILNPATGQFFQLDDPTWQKFRREFRGTSFGGRSGDRTSATFELKGTGQMTPMWNAVLDPSTAEISISLVCYGDMVLPIWDTQRWPSLHRNLFVFPDGIEGSPDPMNMELSGDACDVFGYLAAFGLLEMDTTMNQTNWFAVVDEENELVDIFVEDVLLTTIELPH